MVVEINSIGSAGSEEKERVPVKKMEDLKGEEDVLWWGRPEI